MSTSEAFPKASIVMPCYNHASFLGESVGSILRQTLTDLELIIVDDASKDDSVAIIEDLASKDSRVKLLAHKENMGASRSRNDGLRASRGEYVAFCDADDMWVSDKLECQTKLLDGRPDCDITYCDSEIIDGAGRSTGKLFSDLFPIPGPSEDLFSVLSARNFINTQTVLARRHALKDQLFFDESIRWVEDWWQWIRLSRRHQFLYDPHVLARYRVHQQSTGFTQKPGIVRNRWKVCKRNLCSHSDLPISLQALLWYQMGVELSLLGYHRMACAFFRQSLRLRIKGGCSLKSLILAGTRMAQEYWWQRAFRKNITIGRIT